jgi:hypothetical protein
LCRWKNVKLESMVDDPAFIVHFAGCGMCSSPFSEGASTYVLEAVHEYLRIYSESRSHVKDAGKLAAMSPPLNILREASKTH